MVDIKLIGPEINGKAGERVTLRAEFAAPCWSCIHERREKTGYARLSDQNGNSQHVFDAEIHDDTTHFIFSLGDNGRPDLGMTNNVGQLWCPVTVTDAEPSPEPDKKDLGKYLYKVGLLSDQHTCFNNDGNTPSDSSDDWGDETDLKAAMDIFVADKEVKFVAGCGDVAESQTNVADKHPEATCDADYKEFIEDYDVPYWQVAGLRFFSPLGNHDFYGLFESRKGDSITGKKNSETTIGYNSGVFSRLALWPTDQKINAIQNNGRCRITFELESGKSSPIGQADMNFFSYNDYVDLYARKGGYTGNSVWDSNKGGISDEAIRCAKSYVNSHWDECKNQLVMWNSGGGHGRNAYSKMNYWLKKDNTIFIFLSVDYGNDVWPVNSSWHDRMIHARTIININEDDPYTKRLKEYVAGTGYGDADRLYDYQYYSPNSLIWLKEIVDNNPDCKIVLFTHHFLPNRVGNGVGMVVVGNWQYADIHPADEKDPKEGNTYPVGSNALTGIEFWFFNKLLNEHKNILMFSGHSHISWSADAAFDNHDYPIIQPSVKDKYVYTKASPAPTVESGWTVSLPSMSKPRQIVNGQSVRRYHDAEMGVMEVYERGVIIKGYRIKEDDRYVYDPAKPLLEKVIILM